jgi:hypothetical protein
VRVVMVFDAEPDDADLAGHRREAHEGNTGH